MSADIRLRSAESSGLGENGMTHNTELGGASDPLRREPGSLTEALLDVPPPAADAPARVDETGVELKRGAFLNTILRPR